jgi:uncharacterized protein YbjT (DUF2867 family)
MKKILVLGGSGFVGHHLCEALNRLHYRVTVPTRRLPARSIQTLPFVDVVEANVHDEAALDQLVQGQDVVINLVAILHGSEEEFQSTHVKLGSQIAKTCAKVNSAHLENKSKNSPNTNIPHASTIQTIRPIHFIQMSALGADPQAFKSAPSLYLQSKGEAEKKIIDLCQASNTPLSILRPSVIFGADDQFINLFASLQKIFPVVPLGCAEAQFQPVWVQDVVSAMVACIQGNPSSRTIEIGVEAGVKSGVDIYELGGPEVLSLKELVHIAGRFIGHERLVLPLPLPFAKLQAFVMQHLPGKTLMSLDNVASMQVPNTLSGKYPGLKELGLKQPKSISAAFIPHP